MAILGSMAAADTARLDAEYRALTEGCGLFDRSERGKLALSGTDAREFLNGQVTNEVADLKDREGCYAVFLTHKGKMLGDLRILAVDEPGRQAPAIGSLRSELLLDTERVALQGLFDMIRRFKVGYDVELHKRTLERSLLSLVGPRARTVAIAAADTGTDAEKLPAQELPLTEHAHVQGLIAGRPVRLIATAAPDGIDVLCNSEDSESVHAALIRAGAQVVEEQAAEILRVERGRPRYGVDLDESVIPQEAGLNERAVSFTKGCYVGQETVARLYYKGKPNRHLRGLRLSAPVAPGTGLLLGERAVGQLSSLALSPAFGPIGLGLIRREAELGVTLGLDGNEATAEVVALPFS